MLGMSNTTNLPSTEEEDPCGEPDEPPDPSQSKRSVQPSGNLYTKSATTGLDTKKESLLTRALLDRPEQQSSDTSSIYIRQKTSIGLPTSSAHSSASTAELTSDGGVTSPERANTPSPPLPSQFTSQRHPAAMDGAVPSKVPYLSIDAPESTVEANLGRKRCIKFACGGKDDSSNDKKKEESKPAQKQEAKSEEPPKRKSMLTFACPTRRSDVETPKTAHASARKSSPNPQDSKAASLQTSTDVSESTPRAIREPKKEAKKETFPGLGDFEHSEATRFHEFASLGEDDEWVNQEPHYKGKITFQDCMKKEDAIRRLGEEAEEEARQDEEDEEDAEDDDDDYDDDNDGDEDESTVHDLSSDDGNESDNEAGFADSDSEEDSEYDFWPSSTVTAATSAEHVDIAHPGLDRKVSDSSVDSLSLGEDQRNMSTASLVKERRRKRAEKTQKSRPGTPDLPDSTDFVCGTLDEDRPMEAAFISCMEERRRSKHVIVPQDIDPSFPTTDPEDNDDDDDEDDDEEDEADSPDAAKQKEVVDQQFGAFKDVSFRGRGATKSRKTTPQHSPKRLQSPPPRRAHHHSPKRLRSPPPLAKKTSQGSRRPSFSTVGPIRPGGINITGLGQKPNRPRTKSLPRTPNPFFIRLEKSWHTSNDDNTTDNGASRCGEGHARGAIDIVKGLEQRRQKRKEKFWRQHCRKTGKDGQERKPLPGKGAERMKELGLVAAERCRAYGLDQAQLVLSV
ncbi:hypothetical protein FQN54_008168 [Arachnomyces sp. PD_36]|nr:hypothetical protein FQN54_008168 [Arachnomyces sp. PD_36]